ncbi:MAG: hypothetical protein ABI662_06060 [Dermatophilaceae bacterium]
MLTVAVALSAVLRLTGRAEPGEIVASFLGASVLGLLIFNPWPGSVPHFPVGDDWAASTALWTATAAAAVALVIRVPGPVPAQRASADRETVTARGSASNV